MKQFGLLGKKLGHSYSPQIHKALCDYEYKLYEKEPHEVVQFIKTSTLAGMNVTIPYKKEAFDACDEHSETALKLHNVNTVVRLPNGRLYGHNTDYFGFSYMLLKSGISVQDKKVLVLGSGGASLTVRVVLKDLGAKCIVIISRSGENHYGNLDKHADADVIVNTTPVGMFPQNGFSPVDLKQFSNLSGVLDLIYNPAKTELLLQAEELGIPCINGLAMLVAQAKESAEYFIGEKINDSEIDRVLYQMKADMQNIILVGMPGCGKSTIGKLLAQQSGRPFYDSDEYIVEKQNCTIPELFEKSGEAGFRTLETDALSELCKLSGCIIATGGGCVTRPENEHILRQNAFIVWLKRDIDSLATTGRPLSHGKDLHKMYNIRKPLYERFADASVSLTSTPAETAKKILELNYEYSCH